MRSPFAGPICYQISVKTGNKGNAGTNANVFVMIYGQSGRTTVHHLDNRLKDDFERGKTSDFMVSDRDVLDENVVRLNLDHGCGRR